MSIELGTSRGWAEWLKNRGGHYRLSRLAFWRWLLAAEKRDGRPGIDLSRAQIRYDPKSSIEDTEE
jgi:hypothetical protein